MQKQHSHQPPAHEQHNLAAAQHAVRDTLAAAVVVIKDHSQMLE